MCCHPKAVRAETEGPANRSLALRSRSFEALARCVLFRSTLFVVEALLHHDGQSKMLGGASQSVSRIRTKCKVNKINPPVMARGTRRRVALSLGLRFCARN